MTIANSKLQFFFLVAMLFLGQSSNLTAQVDSCQYELSKIAKPYPEGNSDTQVSEATANVLFKLKAEIEQISAEPKKDFKFAYQENANFLINLLESDFFLFEEQLENSIQTLVDKITQANQINDAEQMRFLIGRTGIPNAFTLRDGTIVINLGLLSRLENWDQLAFILCHEIAHHHADHVDKKIIEKINLFNSKEFKKKLRDAKKGKELANENLSKLLKESGLSYAKHSRDKELETDALGFEFFKKAGFPLHEAHNALEILWKLDKAKYELPDLKEVFNLPGISWREDWTTSTLSGLSLVVLSEEEKEKFRTHPQVQERIDQIISLGATQSDQRSLELCEESISYDLECLESYYSDENLFEAFILGLQLMNLSTDNSYVLEIVANCLFDFSIARKEHRLSSYVPLPGRKLSEQQNEIATFLDNLNMSALIAIAQAFTTKHIDFSESSTLKSDLKEKSKQLKN